MGCYGNAISPTPHWDRFAATSVVADQFWMDGCHTPDILESLWSSQHRFHRARASVMGLSKDSRGDVNRGSVLQSPGLVVTDDPRVVKIAEHWLHGETLLVEPVASDRFAFGHLIEQAIAAWLPKMDTYPWLWIHSRGLAAEWDAPYELRLTMCDEGDPEPPTDTAPPSAMLDDDVDPDVVFGWQCGAGGQAIAMDATWDSITTSLSELGLESGCLLILAGLQGYPLGEHGRVGLSVDNEQLDAPKLSPEILGPEPASMAYAERLHCPLLIRPGTQLPLGLRFAPLLQPHHLGPLIDSWIENAGNDADEPETTTHSEQSQGQTLPSDSLPREPETVSMDVCTIESLLEWSGQPRDRWPLQHRTAVAVCNSELAMMLPSWSARWVMPNNLIEPMMNPDETPSVQAVELFVMPDDRWQQNEVSQRVPEIREAMASIRDAWLRSSGSNDASWQTTLRELDEALWKPVR